MKKYLDMQTQDGGIGVTGFDEEGKPIERIQAGTTITSMPVKYKSQYEMIERKNKMFFIFDDSIPQVDFYAVPRVDIFAKDNQGGYFGTVGATTDIEDLEAPICYINKNQDIFKVASYLKEFIFHSDTTNQNVKHMEPMLEIVLYNSFQEAKEQLDFIDIGWNGVRLIEVKIEHMTGKVAMKIINGNK